MIGVGYAGKESYVFHRIGQSANPGDTQLRVLSLDRVAFWKKWIGGERRALRLDFGPPGIDVANDKLRTAEELARVGRELIETAYVLKQLVKAGVRVFFYLTNTERTLNSATEKALLAVQAMADEIKAFIAQNQARLKTKE